MSPRPNRYRGGGFKVIPSGDGAKVGKRARKAVRWAGSLDTGKRAPPKLGKPRR
jgi:hypothetical protein